MERNSKHPTWYKPVSDSDLDRSLKVLNSLTSSKDVFISKEDGHIYWYACGPTVYDASHMGHARAYVTFDIIRRILEDYFGYNVHLVMNVTDIDDKIILKARRNYLLDRYIDSFKTMDVAKAIDVIKERGNKAYDSQISSFNEKKDSLLQSLKQADISKRESKGTLEQISNIDIKLGNTLTEKNVFDEYLSSLNGTLINFEHLSELIMSGKDGISESLDNEQGDQVSDHSIFQKHALKYETEFLEDMEALNVRPSNVLTRVSEYVPEIITFVSTIIERGLAYVSADGSVYFDTNSFIDKGHDYAKLSPWAVGDLELIKEGEGSLSGNINGKRNPQDFALWKSSRDGEPFWESPWGKGRPGWHIECSAMASEILGDNFDIHSGGEDLRFPHHDNELAQSEAFFGCKQWVNYFLHAGHLHIEGKKMSKSLKNFITIRQSLEKNTGRQIRLLFLLQGWDKTMNFSQAGLDECKNKEKKLKEFFLELETRSRKGYTCEQKWQPVDVEFNELVISIQKEVDGFLLDNLDYSRATLRLFDLVSETNKYINNSGEQAKLLLLRKSGDFVSKMFKIFGAEIDSWCFTSGSGPSSSEKSSNDKTAQLLDVFSSFRSKIREISKELNNDALMSLCDSVRDEDLVELGVRLEDTQNGSVWKLVDAAEIKEERRQAEISALKKKINKCQRLYQQYQENSFDPALLLKDDEKYSRYNEQGIPTHDKSEQEISKKSLKKLEARYNKQLKKFQQHLQMVEQDSDYISKLGEEITSLILSLESL